MRSASLTLLTFAMFAGHAAAGLIPGGVTVTPGGGYYEFKFDILLPTDYKVKNGDFFTIYDFNGYVAGHNTQPADWTFSRQPLGPNPPHIAPPDLANVINVTWTYHGPDLTAAGSLGVFGAASSLGPHTGDVYFASQDHRAADGRAVGNFTSTDGPDPNSPRAPEPAAIMLIAAGLPFAGFVIARRRRPA
jgi:hypothetical protein